MIIISFWLLHFPQFTVIGIVIVGPFIALGKEASKYVIRNQNVATSNAARDSPPF